MEKADDIKQDADVKDTSQEERPLNASTTNEHLTKVVSTIRVCMFNAGGGFLTKQLSKTEEIKLPSQILIKKSPLLPVLAQKLIDGIYGSFIVEANVLKELVLMDGIDSKMAIHALSYLDDLSDLLKRLKKVIKRCNWSINKYRCLQGPFTRKLKRIYAVLSEFSKKK